LVPLFFAPFFAAIFAFACGGTTSDAVIPPITGIVIPAETLTRGRGCGQAPGQVLKYAAVVFGQSDRNFPPKGGPREDVNGYDLPVTAGIFDCYTDATFVQLPAMPDPLNPTADSFIYRLEVYVYDATTYAAAAQGNPGTGIPPLLETIRAIATTYAIADPMDRDSARAAVRALRASPVTWTTTCVGGQQQDVQVLALCDPLSFGSAGIVSVDGGTSAASITLATDQFALADGGVVACGDGAVPEGGAPQVDAGDAGDAEASAPAAVASTYSTVTIVPSTGGVALPSTDVACPTTYVLQPDQQSAAFSLDVTLKAADGSRVGHTTCTASAEPGRTSSAACNPSIEP
jgi:hypothetical protein